MKVFLEERNEIENIQEIMRKMKVILPQIKITFLMNPKTINSFEMQLYLDKEFIKEKSEESLNEVINYYAKIKSYQ